MLRLKTPHIARAGCASGPRALRDSPQSRRFSAGVVFVRFQF